MRYAGLILICVPTALAGVFYAAAMKKRAKLCMLLSEFLNDTARFITETGADVYRTLKYISQKQKYADFGFPKEVLHGLSLGGELRTVWKECALNDSGISRLFGSEREAFLSSCECFEASTGNELAKRLAEYASHLEQAAKEETRRFAKSGSAAVGLSFLGAAALFIILV